MPDSTPIASLSDRALRTAIRQTRRDRDGWQPDSYPFRDLSRSLAELEAEQARRQGMTLWKVAAIGVAMMSGCAFALGLWQVIR